MSDQKQLSGWQKRLKRKNREQEEKKMKNYFISSSKQSDSDNVSSKVNSFITENVATDSLQKSNSQTMLSEINSIPDNTAVIEDSAEKSDADLQMESRQDEESQSANENGNVGTLNDENSKSLMYSDDPALWPSIITEGMRDFFIEKKPNQNISEIQNSRKICSDKSRVLTEFSFYRHIKNKEKIKRDWLIYSPSKAALFCYVCKLYSSTRQALCDEGFSDWKNVTGRLNEHENSPIHRASVCALSLRTVSCNRIDKQLVNEYQSECKYWRSVLKRVVATIKHLAGRGQPLFGDNETIGSTRNGNFLGSIELISQFDDFTADHLARKGNPGKGHTNYLSSTIVTELLQLMSEKVLQQILCEVRKAKYFGLIVDSSPDVTHTDQLSIVLRYVNEDAEPKERFIAFLPLNDHKSLSLSNCVLNVLENCDLDILNCRGQSYDNASNMAGKYSGLQARIKEISPLADFVPCSTHSLNLVGSNAVDCCQQAVGYFAFVQNIYNFFSASNHRWQILLELLESGGNALTTIKSLSGTRWSAEADATKALRKGYLLIRQALHNISLNDEETAATRHEAGSLCSKMWKFETALLTIIWDTILQSINRTSKTLQNSSLDISSLVPLYNSLIQFINTVRENLNEYEEEAKILVDGETYSVQRKKNISRRLDSNCETECHLSPKEAFRINCHNVICDSLIVQLRKRMEAYSNLEQKFGFLSIPDLSISDKIASAKKFQDYYSADIEENFSDEFLQFSSFLQQFRSPLECLKSMKKLNISHTFPNTEIALRILLTLPVSNSSSERSFSALNNRLKSQTRNSLSQTNLQAFSILSIENDITLQLDFDDIITDFALQKSRKKALV